LPEGVAETRVRGAPFPRGLWEPLLETSRQECVEPRGYAAVMLEPAVEMFGSALVGSGLRASSNAQRRDGSSGTSCDRRHAVTIGLVWLWKFAHQERGARRLREIEAVRIPLIDRCAERSRA
jgi:hypothetical protein